MNSVLDLLFSSFFVSLLFLLSFEIKMEWSSREGDEENNSIFFFDSALLRKFLKKTKEEKMPLNYFLVSLEFL